MALTADHLVVIARGRLLADTTMRELIQANSRPGTQPASLEDGYLRLTGEHADYQAGGRQR
jgi:ABC-2 type transport system ATP-binding protein